MKNIAAALLTAALFTGLTACAKEEPAAPPPPAEPAAAPAAAAEEAAAAKEVDELAKEIEADLADEG